MIYNIRKYTLVVIPALLIFSLSDCKKEESAETIIYPDFITENVVVVVVDGPRWSETWGDPQARYIPNMKNVLAPKGIINKNFHNWGVTRTIPGHTAILTGVYEDINNAGHEFPAYPSFLQTWLKSSNSNPNKAWIVSAKSKIGTLGNTLNIGWRNSYLPTVDALYHEDIWTFDRIKACLNDYHPRLLFINLSGPDKRGHEGRWNGYLRAIEETDSMVNQIQNILDTDPYYAGKTTFIVTNDHGRHLDGIDDGFVSHGDQCSGCTHINFFASGPDFKKNLILDVPREQIDIAPTIGYLLGFEMENSGGQIMKELFK